MAASTASRPRPHRHHHRPGGRPRRRAVHVGARGGPSRQCRWLRCRRRRPLSLEPSRRVLVVARGWRIRPAPHADHGGAPAPGEIRGDDPDGAVVAAIRTRSPCRGTSPANPSRCRSGVDGLPLGAAGSRHRPEDVLIRLAAHRSCAADHRRPP
jgi:hypothetical protein